jgi:hypothetical protein
VDVLLIDKTGKRGIFVECKFTAKPMPHDEYNDLKTAMLAFPGIEEKKMYFISKSGYAESVVRSAKEDGAVLLDIDDLMNYDLL